MNCEQSADGASQSLCWLERCGHRQWQRVAAECLKRSDFRSSRLFGSQWRDDLLRHVRQIFIDSLEIFIGHSPDGLPRHLLAEFMAIGIDAGAHGDHEFLKFPSLYKIEVGPERRQLTGNTAGQFACRRTPRRAYARIDSNAGP